MNPSAWGYDGDVMTPWSRRRAQEQLTELRLALEALGPPPVGAIGRWRHQEEVWRLERAIERLAARCGGRESVSA